MSDVASTSGGRVLIVDDDADVVKAASLLLSRHGLAVLGAGDPLQARSLLATERVDVVLLDLNFTRGATSGEEGLRCLEQLMSDDPQAVVVVVTAHSGINVAVRAMQAGASDFVIKPWNNGRLLATVQSALQMRRGAAGGLAGASADEPEPTLLGDSPAMERVRSLLTRVAPTEAAVLILGEAGSGKSLLARRLHLASPRRAGPVVTVDLSAGPDEAERALFGGRPGELDAMEAAAGGVLVLEEVAEMSPGLQRRLAARLGAGGATLPRIVSTSRRTRAALQGRNGLHDDLLYRLSTVEIVLPPLSARGDDPLRLAEHFLRAAARRHGRPAPSLSPAAAAAVMASPWAGGVRALAQAMERAVIFAEGPACEPADLGLEGPPQPAPAAPALDLHASERALVAAALKRHGFNVSHAARDLGLTRPALYRRMAKHGL